MGWVLLALFCLVLAAPARAEYYPERPVRLVVPYPVGASGDLVARLVARPMARAWGQPVVIDNRPGGAGIAATAAVARARPDGYTLLLTGLNHVANPGLFPNLPFDTEQDFSAISLLGVVDTVLLVEPDSGIHDLRSLIRTAQALPGELRYGSSGIGSGDHLVMELFARLADIRLEHVPYRGAPQALADLLGGRVQLLFTGVPPALPLIQEGRLNALLVGGSRRSPTLPGVPTAQEAGLRDFDVEIWFGLLGPAGMQPWVMRTIAEEAARSMAGPEVRSRMRRQGITPVGSGPGEFTTVIARDLERWSRLIRDSSIRAE